jgi:hypothetical protein
MAVPVYSDKPRNRVRALENKLDNGVDGSEYYFYRNLLAGKESEQERPRQKGSSK